MSHLSILMIEFLQTLFPNICCSALRSSFVSAVDRLQTVQCHSELQSCGTKCDYNCNLVVIMSASPCCIRQFAALTTGCACTQAMTRSYCSCTRRATSHSINAASNCSESTQDPENRIPVSRILRSLAARLDLLKRIRTFKCACTMCYPRNGHALP